MSGVDKRAGNVRESIKLVEGISPLETVNLAAGSGVRHVVNRSRAETVRELRAARTMVTNPELFLAYPLATTLLSGRANAETEKSVTSFESPFSNLTQKAHVVEQINTIFEESRLNSSLKDDVLMVADEVICNALFNAPQPEGKNRNSLAQTVREARQTDVREAVIKMGAFKGFLALACHDKYGTLKPLQMLDRVRKCLEQGPGEAMNISEVGTAGIGSYMIFSACTSLFLCVKPGEQTQVCALFPLTASAKARMLNPKNLHWREL